MEKYDKFKFIQVRKLKSPKVRKNPLIKSFKKEFVKNVQDLNHKKIKLKSKKSKQYKKKEFEIPTSLSIKSNIHDISPKLLSVDFIEKPLHDNMQKLKVKSPKKKLKKLTKKIKKSPNKYKDKTISVKFKKNNKEKEINQLLKSFDKLDIVSIQNKLKSKGIDTKNKDKNKLLKYIYLLTCVDDNINVIKG